MLLPNGKVFMLAAGEWNHIVELCSKVIAKLDEDSLTFYAAKLSRADKDALDQVAWRDMAAGFLIAKGVSPARALKVAPHTKEVFARFQKNIEDEKRGRKQLADPRTQELLERQRQERLQNQREFINKCRTCRETQLCRGCGNRTNFGQAHMERESLALCYWCFKEMPKDIASYQMEQLRGITT